MRVYRVTQGPPIAWRDSRGQHHMLRARQIVSVGSPADDAALREDARGRLRVRHSSPWVDLPKRAPRSSAEVAPQIAAEADRVAALVDSMTRPELLEHAAELGVDIPVKGTKLVIARAIAAAEETP